MQTYPLSFRTTLFLAIGLLAITLLPWEASAQVSATAFTYQGELKDHGVGVNSSTAAFCFRLWDDETAGHQIGDDFRIRPVEIVDGVFTTLVDFGEDAFNGQVRWLEIGVDVTGGTNYTWMTPRQPLTATPTALHALHGGDNPWTINGSHITYTSGNVGVGTTSPTSKLDVQGMTTEPIVKSVSQQHGSDAGTAIEGEVEAERGYGVLGKASNTVGMAAGVWGRAYAPGGIGVGGFNDAGSGDAIGVYGRSDSPTGYAGYFRGRGYFDGWVGIGQLSPSSALDVDGAVTMDAFQLDAPTEDGYVLTSNATGRGTWQPAPTVGGYWSPGEGWIYYEDGEVGIGTNSPDAQLHVRGTGTDPVLRVESYDSGAGSGVGIFAELTTDDGFAVHGSANTSAGQNAGVYGESYSPAGHGVRGHNGAVPGGGAGVRGTAIGDQSSAISGLHLASSGYGKAIFGRSDSPDGFGGYFMGKGYFSGNLGIGITSATEKLDVDGTVQMTGFKLATAPQSGYVLTSDASGQGTWQEPAASTVFWENQYGSSIHYSAGNVGIGVANPQAMLDVNGDVECNTFWTNSIDTYSMKFRNTPTVGHVLTCIDSQGNADWQEPPEGGLWNESTSGAIYYNGGNVGIGEAFPSKRLEVNGSFAANSIQITNGAQSGYVLTSDASGNGTWEPAGGMGLPYEGTTSTSGSAFSVTNTGTGWSAHAIYGKIEATGGSSDAAAGYFSAPTHGHAIIATNVSGSAILAHNTNVGSAIYAKADGSQTEAGDFRASGYQSNGVEGKATGEAGHGVYATASGGGAALMAEATGYSTIGVVAKGSSKAGKFYGNVAIYDYTTEDIVLELGKGLDYAEGFDITANDQPNVAPGTVLVIDPQDPGHLAQSRRAYDRRVAGIAAGANGLGSGVRLGGGAFDQDVALAGRVYCNVIAVAEDIEPGDLLTTAEVPGYAMEVQDHARAQGAILGKAMGRLAKGERGQILVLVTLQ